MTRNQWDINTAAIAKVLATNDITKRSQLLPPHYDADADFVNVYDLGEVLGPQLRKMVDEYGPIEWKAALPDVEYDGPYEVLTTPGGVQVTIVDSGEKPIGE